MKCFLPDFERKAEEPNFGREMKPSASYGIIVFVRKKDKILYQMFRQRNTYEYGALIRGYTTEDNIPRFIELLPHTERKRLKENSFDDLWDDYWTDHSVGQYTNLKTNAAAFIALAKEALEKDTSESTSLQSPLTFSKGKLESDEDPLGGALREYQEETGCNLSAGTPFFVDPIVERHMGSDGRSYEAYFYVVESREVFEATAKAIDGKLRPTSLGFELEEAIWIGIPVFGSRTEFVEQMSFLEQTNTNGIYQRHFRTIFTLHERLTCRDLDSSQ